MLVQCDVHVTLLDVIFLYARLTDLDSMITNMLNRLVNHAGICAVLAETISASNIYCNTQICFCLQLFLKRIWWYFNILLPDFVFRMCCSKRIYSLEISNKFFGYYVCHSIQKPAIQPDSTY